MLGVASVLVGALVGVAIIWWSGPSTHATMPKQTAADPAAGNGAPGDAVTGKSGEELMHELRSTGRTTRTFLDICFLLFIVVAVLSILLYELKADPLTELARVFPREVNTLAQFFRGIRESWPANMLKR